MNRSVSTMRMIAAAMAIVGAFLIWQSTSFGMNAFGAIVRQMGGSISGDAAIQVATWGPVISLQVIGGILMIVGLLRALEPAR